MIKKTIPIFVILIIFLFIAFQQTAQADNDTTIKVALYFGENMKSYYTLESKIGFYVLNKNGEILTEILSDKIEISTADVSEINSVEIRGDLQISDPIVLPVSKENPIYFTPIEEDLIILDSSKYRGKILVLPSGGKISIINELNLEEYLYGVMPMEMPPSWPMEALKAQAVAARTYAVNNLSKWETYGFDLKADTSDQLYKGYNVEDERTNYAVDQTRGLIATYDGNPILAMYHSDSGGVTESSENVYGTDIPYLQSVKELYDVNSPHSNWQVKLSSDKINEVFKGIKGSIGHINDISILERNSSGRVGKVLLSGTSGEKIISGEELRKIFGLKSTLFDIVGNKTSLDLDISILTGNGSTHNVSNLKGIQVFSQGQNRSIKGGGINILGYSKQRTIDDFVKTSPDSYVVEGRGWGHGIGMNQWGAKAMAEQGHDYINILQHYYKNIEINQYNNK